MSYQPLGRQHRDERASPHRSGREEKVVGSTFCSPEAASFGPRREESVHRLTTRAASTEAAQELLETKPWQVPMRLSRAPRREADVTSSLREQGQDSGVGARRTWRLLLERVPTIEEHVSEEVRDQREQTGPSSALGAKGRYERKVEGEVA
jgi:hypothetical protein